MRGALLLSTALCCAVFALPANAAITAGNDQVAAARRSSRSRRLKNVHPAPWWIPEGYQRKGKWKPGHCSKVVTGSS